MKIGNGRNHPHNWPGVFLGLSKWPVDQPRNWVKRVNQVETAAAPERLRVSVNRGKPFGSKLWVVRMAKRFDLESTLRPSTGQKTPA